MNAFTNLTTVELKRALEIAKKDEALKTVAKIEKLLNVTKPQNLSAQKVWIDSDEAYYIGVTVASGTFTGLGGSWFTRKVSNIIEDELYGKQGEIKLNKKTLKVVLDCGNEWRLV